MFIHTTSNSLSPPLLSPSEKPSRKRWLILLMSCTALFGNYFAYDQVASLNLPLESYLSLPSSDYQYLISSFYVIYSLPNIFLPFFGGQLIDRYGVRKLIFFFAGFIVLGQFVFAVGLHHRNSGVAVLGRLLFGLGGENLSVAQARITTKWFIGNELALAVGVNLSVARLGSVFNDIISPHLAIHYSLPTSLYFGVLTCLFSFCSTCVLIYIDRKYEFECAEVQKREVVALKESSYSLNMNNTEEKIRIGERAGSAAGTRRSTRKFEGGWNEIVQSVKVTIAGVKNFQRSYWIVCAILVVLYGTVVPFNTIHSAFLELKWYQNDPKTAAQIMGVPDTISALLVPFIGTLTDRYGHRVHTIFLTSLFCSIVHFTFAFATKETMSSPVFMLVILGIAYSMLFTFLPCVPCLVEEKWLGVAYGITTSLSNLSWTIFPIIVATLINSDPTYFSTEFFFFSSTFLGVVLSLYLGWLDERNGGVLRMPEGKWNRAKSGMVSVGGYGELMEDEWDDGDETGIMIWGEGADDGLGSGDESGRGVGLMEGDKNSELESGAEVGIGLSTGADTERLESDKDWLLRGAKTESFHRKRKGKRKGMAATASDDDVSVVVGDDEGVLSEGPEVNTINMDMDMDMGMDGVEVEMERNGSERGEREEQNIY